MRVSFTVRVSVSEKAIEIDWVGLIENDRLRYFQISFIVNNQKIFISIERIMIIIN